MDKNGLGSQYTQSFKPIDSSTEVSSVITRVYNALLVKGYDPISQLVGYILSEDPTYITNYDHARSLITRLDRYEILRELVRNYLENNSGGPEKQ